MQNLMKAAVYTACETVEIRQLEIPTPKAGQVRIKVELAGICGTDLTIYSGKHPRARAPLVMGHEIVGEIDIVGPDCYRNFKPGNIVTANPLLWCGHCRSCLRGANNVCETLGLFGIDKDGGFGQFMIADEDRVHLLASDVSREEAVLCEPLAVGIHALRTSSFKPGDTVSVIGAGIIGVLIGSLALNSGASRVAITDVNQWRLDQAIKVGLEAFNIQSGLTSLKQADVVFECSGHPSSYESVTGLAVNLGEVVFVGIPHQSVPLLVRDMVFRELKTTAVRVYRNEEFAMAAGIVSNRQMDLRPFVTTVLPLNRLDEGIQMARSGHGWKIAINPQEER
jgi:(R,R)-butanediol dehydrogenase / meso-butanediol dehydrogenase / diacetyl reductase